MEKKQLSRIEAIEVSQAGLLAYKKRLAREAGRIEDKKRYHLLKSLGLCVDCGRSEAVAGKARCEKCLAKKRMESKQARARAKQCAVS